MKADIYIFDETFTGLDDKSIALVQKMLKKYLPGLTFLVVDHKAKNWVSIVATDTTEEPSGEVSITSTGEIIEFYSSFFMI